jgi:glycerol-3-phosphate acyltransferase PlsY
MLLEIILTGLVGYFMGGIPFARLVSLARGVDLEQVGSGVASVANVRHTQGWRWGLIVSVLEIAKVLLPVGLTDRLAGPDWAAYMATCLVVGHNWPAFSGFNGGRGILAALAAAAVLLPRELGILALVLVPIALKLRDTAPFALAGMLSFPALAFVFGEPRAVVIAFIAIAYIVAIRRLTAPPHGRRSFRVLASKLIFDRPDPNRHWALDQSGDRRMGPH